MTYGLGTQTARNFRPRLSIWTVADRAIGLVAFWLDRRRQRRQLAWLDERLLQDIGVSHEKARQEIAKPFWR